MLFFVILAIMLMVMDKRVAGFATIRAALSIPVAPIQYAVSWPSRVFASVRSAISSHDDLVKQNLQLQADQLLLQSKLQRLTAIESENTYLRSLLKSAKKIKDRTLIAELLAVDSEPFVNKVTLNKGSQDGVYVNQPVLDATGVMGQVIEVGLVTSRVLLITDPRSGIAVENARNGVRSVAIGDSYSDYLRLLYVPETVDIKVGDVFLTSGLGDHYPEGYPVGTVVSLTKDPSHQFSKIYLEPSAQIDKSRQVLLVWYQNHA